jgi:hypothetical protein
MEAIHGRSHHDGLENPGKGILLPAGTRLAPGLEKPGYRRRQYST